MPAKPPRLIELPIHRPCDRRRTAPRAARRRLLTHLTGLLLATLAIGLGAQEGRWIHDELRVDMRSGPTFQNRIIDFLPSGTPVTVLETRDDWIRIRARDKEGWIQSQYTTDAPIAADRLESAQGELARLRRERETRTAELEAARAEGAELRETLAATTEALEQARGELAEIRRTAADALRTAEALRALRADTAAMRARLEALEAENVMLASDNRADGIKWGAGAVLLGVLIALAASAFGRRRRPSEWI